MPPCCGRSAVRPRPWCCRTRRRPRGGSPTSRRPRSAGWSPSAWSPRGSTSRALPSVPMLLGYAAEMEVERDHVLGRRITDEDDIFAAEQDLLAQANADVGASDELLGSFEALGSEARFDQVVYDGAAFGHAGEVHVGSEEEMDFLGIPGLLDP